MEVIVINNINTIFEIKLTKDDVDHYKHMYISDGMQYVYGETDLIYKINKCMIVDNFYTTLYPDCLNGGIHQYWVEGFFKSAIHIVNIIK